MQHTQIGIDKIKFSGFMITYLDTAYLEELSRQNGSIQISSTTIDGERRIEIADNYLFSDLIMGCRWHGCQLIEYVYLTMSPTNVCGHNQDNLLWSEYNACLGTVLEYIQRQYHICLGTNHLKVKMMEINCNIPLDGAYVDYDRVIRLLMSFLPKHLRNSQPYASRRIIGNSSPSYLHSNNSMGVKIYNKTAQMRAKFPDFPELEEDCDIMRIEISLDSPEKIASSLGSNLWSELSDTAIADYYHRYIIDTMQRRYQQWHQKRQSELIRLLRRNRREHPKDWHHLTMQHIRNQSEIAGVPYILDIEQVAEAYKQLPDKHRNRSRAIRSLLEIPIEDDLYKHQDREKVREIFTHFPSPNQSSI